MSSPLMLNGNVEDHEAGEIQQLHDRIGELESELRQARLQASAAKRNAEIAMGNLKKQLSPLYRALQQVFGELEAVGVEEASAPQTNARWESWKQRMPGRPAEVIDLLLIHKTMTAVQLMAALRCAKQTVYDLMSKLGRSGIVMNNGGRYSLKE